MTLADDLIAVRTLLILKGRAVGGLIDDEGRVCLRQAMMTVSRSQKPEPSVHHVDLDSDMYQALVPYLPAALRAQAEENPYCYFGCSDLLSLFNDMYATDEDILNLIDKALADLGAI